MNAKILYIEDNPHHIEIVRRILDREGYTFMSALNGEQGLEMAAYEQPDLILADINMPGLNGVEVAQRIKTTPELAHIPVLALTTNTMHGDREHYLRLHFDGYIAKPIIRHELINTLHRLLARG